jgi:hypothetical protein
MEFKLNITAGQIGLALLILFAGSLIGFFYGETNNEELGETFYLKGHYDTINKVLANGMQKFCDNNNVCVTLYEEQYIIKQLGLDKNN